MEKTDLTDQQLFLIAEIIDAAKSDVRYAKGKLYNTRKEGTRMAIAEKFGWNLNTSRDYGFVTKVLVTAGYPAVCRGLISRNI